MAFIPTPHVAKVSIEATWGGATVVITIWFEKGTDYATDDLTNLATAVRTWVTGELVEVLSDEISFFNVNATAQHSSSAPSVDVAISPPVTGELAVASVPTAVAPTVTFRTANRGRSYRGRNYLPGITEAAQVTPGLLGSTAIADYAATYALLSAVESSEGCEHVVVSHFTGGAARSAGETTPVTAYTVHAPLRNQRRRQIGVGS